MAGIYVDGIEICNIPIGKDDARGSPVWVFYREWLSGRKTGRKWLKSLVENEEKHEILHESGREKSKSSFD